MTIDYRHGISILEVIVYSPCLFIALWMAFHHGFKKSSGWYFFNIFCLARVIGAACYLATIRYPSNINLYITWAVCTSLGLSPLLLACLGLLSRANDSIMRKTANPLHPLIFRVVATFSLVGVILSIVGTTQNSDITHGLVTIESKIGLIFYLITWFCVFGLFFLILKRTESIEDGERRLLLAVGISVPLILVRLVYSYIFAFGGDADFNLLSGNVTIQLVMCVLEEILVVLVCLGIGLTLEVRPAAEYTQQLSTHSGEENLVELESGHLPGQARPNRRVQRPKRRGGPITKLVIYIVDEVKDRKR
ncbi:hypothetical protein CBS147333_2664 [Penicillium roqueforti]|nr:hypothetical protein CBS147355_4655 [Penicillium roqueforti]KAI2705580.1 hypothetical protein CBS147372_1883 [Penicillium roqueforti]KAI2714017.1 hypothetical protein CBS147354_7661 [Penicillium roqueforti]KAI3113828.1 hypothetical protein CBS147333_2664 [Penicillium roqueforti]KAI3166589.1 hypothetical protein CBS147317_2532 [Penicillium roqueforti]